MAEQSPESYPGYEELHESLGKTHFSVVLVPGQGPEKRVLIPGELTPDEQEQWDTFKLDPLHGNEPTFRVIESELYLQELRDIQALPVPEAERQRLTAEKRIEWQNNPRFAFNRWERVNVIAAGVAMLAGITDEVIFTGGTTTLPEWKDREGNVGLSHEFRDHLHSEGELMRDLLVQMFGRRLFEKDHPEESLRKEYDSLVSKTQSVQNFKFEDYARGRYQNYLEKELLDKVHMETMSTNTLQNFSFSRNKVPNMENVGIVASNFQLQRAIVTAKLYQTPLAPENGFDAQHILEERVNLRGKTRFHDLYSGILGHLSDPYANDQLMEYLVKEKRWITALSEPEYAVGFIAGYIFDLNDLAVVQGILNDMKRLGWIEYAREVFGKAGLDFDTCTQEDLTELAEYDTQKIADMKEALSIFTKTKGGPNGPREGYVPPAVSKLFSDDVAFLLPNYKASESK